MNAPTQTRNHARFVFAGLAAIAAIAALGAAPAHARIFVGVGLPFGYYGPGPYYAYPGPYYSPYYYPPSYYAPPPAYSYYPPAAGPAPSAYAPPAGNSSARPAPSASAAPTAAPGAAAGVTYTDKPAFTNSAGQTCREYKTSSTGHDIFGTACQQTDGQWRVVN